MNLFQPTAIQFFDVQNLRMGQAESGWSSPFGTTSLKFVNTIMIPGGNRGSSVLSAWSLFRAPVVVCPVRRIVIELVVWLAVREVCRVRRSVCGRRNKRWNVERRKALETRKLSFNPHSTQQLVHVITLLHFLVLKVNIDKPIILLPSPFVVLLQHR